MCQRCNPDNVCRELQRVRLESATESKNTEEWLSDMRDLRDQENNFKEAQGKTNVRSQPMAYGDHVNVVSLSNFAAQLSVGWGSRLSDPDVLFFLATERTHECGVPRRPEPSIHRGASSRKEGSRIKSSPDNGYTSKLSQFTCGEKCKCFYTNKSAASEYKAGYSHCSSCLPFHMSGLYTHVMICS